jgi:hypothetical protein
MLSTFCAFAAKEKIRRIAGKILFNLFVLHKDGKNYASIDKCGNN